MKTSVWAEYFSCTLSCQNLQSEKQIKKHKSGRWVFCHLSCLLTRASSTLGTRGKEASRMPPVSSQLLCNVFASEKNVFTEAH